MTPDQGAAAVHRALRVPSLSCRAVIGGIDFAHFKNEGVAHKNASLAGRRWKVECSHGVENAFARGAVLEGAVLTPNHVEWAPTAPINSKANDEAALELRVLAHLILIAGEDLGRCSVHDGVNAAGTYSALLDGKRFDAGGSKDLNDTGDNGPIGPRLDGDDSIVRWRGLERLDGLAELLESRGAGDFGKPLALHIKTDSPWLSSGPERNRR